MSHQQKYTDGEHQCDAAGSFFTALDEQKQQSHKYDCKKRRFVHGITSICTVMLVL
jgi:hypothetical protein